MAKMQEKTSTIIRTSKRENPYVMIDKYGLNDERLSWKAKGLLAYLLSKPDDWQVYESDLIKRAADGRDSVRTGLRELEKYGYLSRRQIRGENGSFGHMEYIVYERPITLDDTEEITVDGKSVHGEKSPQTENPSTENPMTGNPTTENPPLLINDLSNNDLNMIDCMGASAEIAVASESVSNEIYETLQTEAPKQCYMQGMPISTGYINEIYLMLVNQFPNQLSPEVVRIACELYFNRACRITIPEGVTMAMDIQNPVGFFQICYKDAIKQYKAQRSMQADSDTMRIKPAAPKKATGGLSR